MKSKKFLKAALLTVGAVGVIAGCSAGIVNTVSCTTTNKVELNHTTNSVLATNTSILNGALNLPYLKTSYLKVPLSHYSNNELATILNSTQGIILMSTILNLNAADLKMFMSHLVANQNGLYTTTINFTISNPNQNKEYDSFLKAFNTSMVNLGLPTMSKQASYQLSLLNCALSFNTNSITNFTNRTYNLSVPDAGNSAFWFNNAGYMFNPVLIAENTNVNNAFKTFLLQTLCSTTGFNPLQAGLAITNMSVNFNNLNSTMTVNNLQISNPLPSGIKWGNTYVAPYQSITIPQLTFHNYPYLNTNYTYQNVYNVQTQLPSQFQTLKNTYASDIAQSNLSQFATFMNSALNGIEQELGFKLTDFSAYAGIDNNTIHYDLSNCATITYQAQFNNPQQARVVLLQNPQGNISVILPSSIVSSKQVKNTNNVYLINMLVSWLPAKLNLQALRGTPANDLAHLTANQILKLSNHQLTNILKYYANGSIVNSQLATINYADLKVKMENGKLYLIVPASNPIYPQMNVNGTLLAKTGTTNLQIELTGYVQTINWNAVGWGIFAAVVVSLIIAAVVINAKFKPKTLKTKSKETKN